MTNVAQVRELKGLVEGSVEWAIDFGLALDLLAGYVFEFSYVLLMDSSVADLLRDLTR